MKVLPYDIRNLRDRTLRKIDLDTVIKNIDSCLMCGKKSNWLSFALPQTEQMRIVVKSRFRHWKRVVFYGMCDACRDRYCVACDKEDFEDIDKVLLKEYQNYVASLV